MRAYVANYFTLTRSFVFYGVYHTEWRNKLVHIVCVPLIFTTALTLLSFVPLTSHVTLADVVALLYAVTFVIMEPVAGVLYAPVLLLMHHIGTSVVATQHIPLVVAVHLAGWAAQIAAHRLCERDKPAFLDDPLQAVHSAVFFVWLEVLFALGYRRRLHAQLTRLVAERARARAVAANATAAAATSPPRRHRRAAEQARNGGTAGKAVTA